ncbi:diazepam binding inhibitor-like protein [Pyronema omphalodes]|nr:diazepam binding inhibitor-like protein [Pyronema omphalodes]
MPSEGSAEFQAAAAKVQQLKAKPDTDALLEIYSLFKQVTVGDVTAADKPGFMDFQGKAKYAAREKIKGMSAEEAEQKYIALVERLVSEIGLQE